MKLSIFCWLPVIGAMLPLQAGAQSPEDLPTLPALPVSIDMTPSPPPVQTVPNYGPPIYPPIDPFRRSFRPGQQVTVAGPASPAEIAAAMIKADEANVERQRSVIRYLGGVDCTYYPHAESALIAALRGDPHETVRCEAALALSNSRCWTRNTIAALNQAMSGGSADGFPGERSERVRGAARQALGRYAAANPPSQPKGLSWPSPTSSIRRASAEVLPSSFPAGGYFPSGPGNAARQAESALPTLRPIGIVPDEALPMPTYEPTPMPQPLKR